MDYTTFDKLTNTNHDVKNINCPKSGSYPYDSRIDIIQSINKSIPPDIALSLAQIISSESYHGHDNNALTLYRLIPSIQIK